MLYVSPAVGMLGSELFARYTMFHRHVSLEPQNAHAGWASLGSEANAFRHATHQKKLLDPRNCQW